MVNRIDIYDVVIIGGGPAGSTAATLLAQAGRRVILLERERFPRFHIGESLLPFSMQAFDRLGVREKLDRAFLPKYGGEIMAACGTKSIKFYFKDGFRARRDHAYQVTRSEFDKLLLDHAREQGAEVREETDVKRIEFEPGRVKIDIENSDGRIETLQAKYVLDCSGRQTVLGNMFRLKKAYDHLQKFSVFAHYENVDREEGIDATLIRIVRGIDRWFWIIPLTATRASIGVVMDTTTFRATKLSPEAALEKCLDEQPMMLRWMKRAERVSPVYSAGDYSYRNTRFFGDRWLLAGDAAGFIDPVFSSGVFLAITSAERAADTLDQVLRNESRRQRLFRRVLALLESADGCLSQVREFLVSQRKRIYRNISEPHRADADCIGGQCRPGGQRRQELSHPMADVAVLFLCEDAAIFPVVSAALARAEKGRRGPGRSCDFLNVDVDPKKICDRCDRDFNRRLRLSLST